MAKKSQPRSFNDVLALLGSQKFDVAAAHEGARRTAGAVRVSKYGCAAEIAASTTAPAAFNGAASMAASAGPSSSSAMMLSRPGWLLNGEITRLVDKGYQKFLKSSKLEIPATADHLRALHNFSTELNAATGEMNLFNESLGTTSDKYEYDRVLGRPDQPVH
jgi:hypothetical protein